jgi:hypothetical protein
MTHTAGPLSPVWLTADQSPNSSSTQFHWRWCEKIPFKFNFDDRKKIYFHWYSFLKMRPNQIPASDLNWKYDVPAPESLNQFTSLISKKSLLIIRSYLQVFTFWSKEWVRYTLKWGDPKTWPTPCGKRNISTVHLSWRPRPVTSLWALNSNSNSTELNVELK